MSLSDLFFMALLMVYELILAYPHLSAAIVAGIIIPWAWALAKRVAFKNWYRVWRPALLFTLLSGVVAFFALPVFFHSAHTHLNYYVDWLFHIASTASIMAYAWLVVVPLLLLWCGCNRKEA